MIFHLYGNKTKIKRSITIVLTNQELAMSITSLGAGSYQTVGSLGASTTNVIATPVATPDVSAAAAAAGVSSTSSSMSTGLTSSNTSALNTAITQALSQINPNLDLTKLLSASGQQSSSNFASSLLSSLTGLNASGATTSNLFSMLNDSSGGATSTASSGNNINQLLATALGKSSSSSAAPAPVQLNKSSATFNLQSSIQQLITTLGSMFGYSSGSVDSSTSALQSSFNSLVTSSGGNPTQANLQSFLKLVAANVAGSTSIGSLFSTNA